MFVSIQYAFYGDNFVAQSTRVNGSAGFHLTLKRKGICLFSGDAVLNGQLFSRHRHRNVAVGIRKGAPKRVFEFALSQQKSPARAANHVRRLTHVFRAACKNKVSFVQEQRLGAADNRLKSRPAEAVHGQRRRALCDSGA